MKCYSQIIEFNNNSYDQLRKIFSEKIIYFQFRVFQLQMISLVLNWSDTSVTPGRQRQEVYNNRENLIEASESSLSESHQYLAITGTLSLQTLMELGTEQVFIFQVCISNMSNSYNYTEIIQNI